MLRRARRRLVRPLLVLLAVFGIIVGTSTAANAAQWYGSFFYNWPPSHSTASWYCGATYRDLYTSNLVYYIPCVVVSAAGTSFQGAVLMWAGTDLSDGGTLPLQVISDGGTAWGSAYHAHQYCSNPVQAINLDTNKYYLCYSSTFHFCTGTHAVQQHIWKVFTPGDSAGYAFGAGQALSPTAVVGSYGNPNDPTCIEHLGI